MIEYEDWFEKLSGYKTEEPEHVGILVDAYCCLHKQTKSNTIYTTIKAIYDSFYHDPYFLLKIIFETMDLRINGNRLNYVRVIASRKLGRI